MRIQSNANAQDVMLEVCTAFNKAALAEQHAMGWPFNDGTMNPSLSVTDAICFPGCVEQVKAEGKEYVFDDEHPELQELPWVTQELIDRLCKALDLGTAIDLQFNWGEDTPSVYETFEDHSNGEYDCTDVISANWEADHVPDDWVFDEQHTVVLAPSVDSHDVRQFIRLVIKFDEDTNRFYIWCPQASGVCWGG